MLRTFDSSFSSGVPSAGPSQNNIDQENAIPTATGYTLVPTAATANATAIGVDVMPERRSTIGEDPENYHFSRCCVILSVLSLIGAIILCATIASSFHYVKYDQYALLQDRYGTVRLSRVYEEGRYFFPLNYNMIKFPATYIPVQLDTLVFTETGLEFDIQVEFYYRLPKDNLGKIYNSYSFNYDDLVHSNAKTTIKNSAANLKFDLYFTNRTYIESLFANNVANVLLTDVYVDMPIELFRISSVTVPDSIIELSLESQIALQNNDLLEKTQKVAVIRAETDRLVATITAQTKQVLQFANNEAKRLIEKATSYANRIEITARAEGIHTMLVALNISDTTKSAANNDTAFTTQLVRTLALLDNAVNTTIVPGVGDVLVNVNG